MAENPTLPGTAIEIVAKYAPGKRLDFPDFGEVCKTTFSKGIITDFKKISDDPIAVESMVKVEVEGSGESDYIPLFYHPKEGYWDDEFADEPVLATDFDEETGAFKQAWQSFRVDDEVAVMLKEGTPIAVVGFADGVPRIGEDIFILEVTVPMEGIDNPYYISVTNAQKTEIDEHWNISNPAGWTTPDVGPDGKDLGIEKETEVATSSIGTFDQTQYRRWFGGSGSYNLYYVKRNSVYQCRISVWPIVVGPLLFAIYMSNMKGRVESWYYKIDWTKNGHGVEDEEYTAGPYISGAPLYVSDQDEFSSVCLGDGWWNKEDWDLWFNYWIVNVDTYGTPTGDIAWAFEDAPEAPSGGHSIYSDPYFWEMYCQINGGVYSQELYERVLSTIDSCGDPIEACGVSEDGATLVFSGPEFQSGELMITDPPEGMEIQLGITYFFGDLYGDGPGFYYEDNVCPDGITWKTRPHTKAELEAAGMWPAPA